jgi:hypothetical protein
VEQRRCNEESGHDQNSLGSRHLQLSILEETAIPKNETVRARDERTYLFMPLVPRSPAPTAPDFDPASARSHIDPILIRAILRRHRQRSHLVPVMELAVPPRVRLTVSTGAAPDADRMEVRP